MNQYGGQEDDKVERWEEEPRQYRGWMEYTGPTEPNNRTPTFGLPLSMCAREPSTLPSLMESDESSQCSRDDWQTEPSVPSSSNTSDRKRASKPNLSWSNMPPPSLRYSPSPSPRLRQQHQQQQQPSPSMIEISPGVHVRLRGANETWKAIEQDYYMPAECLCCQTTIFCIQNADYVLCPDCRVVSRMEGSSCQGIGGVGLGFKYEDLANWQADILRNRQDEEQRSSQTSSRPPRRWS
jgi:hypothetical protein